jgi:hypothetical protein
MVFTYTGWPEQHHVALLFRRNQSEELGNDLVEVELDSLLYPGSERNTTAHMSAVLWSQYLDVEQAFQTCSAAVMRK